MALDLLPVFLGLEDLGFLLLLLLFFFLVLEAESSPESFFLDFRFFLTGRRCGEKEASAQSANISSARLPLHSLTLPLFLGATRKLRMRSTRSEWVPFFSRSRTVQTTFSLELVK